MSELFLIRHGQASFGADNYDQLSELGYQQSRLLGAYFAERSIIFDAQVAGAMQRHHQTLDGINEGMGGNVTKPYLSHVGFNEYDFKAMMRSYSKRYPSDTLVKQVSDTPGDKKVYYRLLRQVLTLWSEDGLDDVPETWPQFCQRVQDARRVVQDMAKTYRRILVASSGGAISLFVGTVLNLVPEKIIELNLQMRNTGISHFYFNPEKISLTSFNGIAHLDQPTSSQLITYG